MKGTATVSNAHMVCPPVSPDGRDGHDTKDGLLLLLLHSEEDVCVYFFQKRSCQLRREATCNTKQGHARQTHTRTNLSHFNSTTHSFFFPFLSFLFSDPFMHSIRLSENMQGSFIIIIII